MYRYNVPHTGRFNTQPPEGGWVIYIFLSIKYFSFNTQPPEGGWRRWYWACPHCNVSTHSRPKAAGASQQGFIQGLDVSTHSRPKAAGFEVRVIFLGNNVSTHSRPKAAGFNLFFRYSCIRCFNTQPPEGGWYHHLSHPLEIPKFQHTAARRRLGLLRFISASQRWFQHTAARRRLVIRLNCPLRCASCFNTQPPEGGWAPYALLITRFATVSTHSRPKAAGTIALL